MEKFAQACRGPKMSALYKRGRLSKIKEITAWLKPKSFPFSVDTMCRFDPDWGGECISHSIGKKCKDGVCWWVDSEKRLWLVEVGADGVAYTFTATA